MIRSRLLLVATAALLAGCAPEPDPFGEVLPMEPQVFAPGIVSTGLREYAVSFMPDYSEVYFTRRERRGPSTIFMSRFEEGSWTEPEVAPFSVRGDEGPFISADGSRFFFASRRMMPSSMDRSGNLWWMPRTAAGTWGDPEPVAGEVNHPYLEVDEYDTGMELGPSLTPSGDLLYWSGAHPDWGNDIYVASPNGNGFSAPRALRINSYGDETNATMSPDGRFLVFQGYREAEAFGEQDLYVSARTEYGWSDPELLPEPVNSARNDAYPRFSHDGRLFFFASDRDDRGGYYSIYYVSVEALGLKP